MSPTQTLIKNAASNVVRGGASGLMAIVVPYFLVRFLSGADYAVWLLALQMSAYVAYFDFGLQTAIARFVAQTRHTGDQRRCNEIVSSAGFLLGVVMLAAMAGVLLLVATMPVVFKDAGPAEIAGLRVCIVLIGGSLIIGLPASLLTGILVGYERNEIPAMAIGGCKLVSGVVVILVARHWQNIGTLAALISGFNLLAYVIQLLAVRRMLPSLHASRTLINRAVVREFVSYCASLSSCSVGMFLVGGVDLTIVGHFRFLDVIPYSTAATLVMFLTGINGHVFSSLLAPAARYHSGGMKKRLGELVLYTTRAAVFLNVLVGIPLVVLATPLLRLWIGDAYAIPAAPILQILVAANAMRLVFNPFNVAVLGTGEQRRLILAPILEGLVNVTASVVGAVVWGAIGVAAGTLIGAIFGFAWAYLYNLRKVQEIQLDRGDFARQSLIRPILCFLPAAVVLALLRQIPSTLLWAPLAVALCLSIMVIARWGKLERPDAWAS